MEYVNTRFAHFLVVVQLIHRTDKDHNQLNNNMKIAKLTDFVKSWLTLTLEELSVLSRFRESLSCHEGLGRRTFVLETKEECEDPSDSDPLLVGAPVVHVFKSKLTSAEIWSKSESELWEEHAKELIESELYTDDVKFLAVMSATRYTNALKKRPSREAIQ